MLDDDPIKARSPFTVRAFSLYLRWYLSRNFHAVRVSLASVPLDNRRPLIICSNHPSWWDPAMFIVLMDCLFPGRTGYGPMDRISLEHYTFFRRLGVFGIDPKSRQGADDFLRHGLRILEDHRSVLFVTAEGRFNDVRRRPIELRPGVAHLLKRVPNAVVVPLALEYPFWSERRPEALAHFGLPVVVEAGAGVSTWNKALQVALTQSVDTLAALSMKQDAALFQPLIKGRVGVGGVYDIWRRSASLIRGVHFDPSHEAIMKRSEERRI